MNNYRFAMIKSITLLALLMSAVCCAAVDVEDNAAMDYWQAAAMMRMPRTVEEIQIFSFINSELADLPANAFSLKPEAARWLLGDMPMIAVLNRAASKEVCEFATDIPGSPVPEVNHLAVMQQMSRRGLAVAKAYEYADNRQGAAEIYCSLLQMVEHLDQDINITSGLVAADILQSIVIALEGFLAREPGIEAAKLLTEHLRRMERPVLDLSRYLQEESGRFSRWIMREPGQAESKLARLYGNSPNREAVDRLVTLNPERKEERLRGWVIEYETRMFELADAVNKPFGIGLSRVREYDEDKRSGTENIPIGKNPLIPLLVPTMEPVYERFLLAEAQLSMISIMAYAAHYRAEFGRWPVNLEELSEWMHKPMPRDPFSGNEYFYKLIKLRPRIVTQIPKWMSQQPTLVYSLDVTRRWAREENRLTEYASVVQKEEQDLRGERLRRLQEKEGTGYQTSGSGVDAAVPLR